MLSFHRFTSLGRSRFMSAIRPSRSPAFVPAALFVAALLPACAFVAEAGFDATAGGGGSFENGTAASAGSGGSTQDGSIEIGPDSGGVDPSQPYAGLCSGECAVGGDDCDPVEDAGSPVPTACALTPALGGALAACVPVGTFGEGEPCKTADNCAVALGCVATPNGGVCRSYCCGDVELCPASTYCDLRPMAEDTINAPPISIPVCVPAMSCELLNDEMTCPPSLTCTIVRADGTTSCVVPGSGGLNEPCPCAAGYICSKLKNECKKLCHIGQDAIDCAGAGTCLGGGVGYPDGFGVCSPSAI